MKKSYQYLIIAVASIALIYVFELFSNEKVDCFFLDLSQMVFQEKNPATKNLAIVRIPGVDSIRDFKPLDYERFKKLNDNLHAKNPERIIYYFLIKDISSDLKEQKKIFDLIKDDQRVYLHANIWFPDKSLNVHPLFKAYPRFFSPTYTRDRDRGGQDGKSRRVYLAWTSERADEFVEYLKKEFHFSIHTEDFKGILDILGSRQAWMKLWQDDTYGNYQMDSEYSFANGVDLEGKNVFVGRNDTDDEQYTLSIFAFWGNSDTLPSEKRFTQDTALTANIITNLIYPEVHIKKAPPWAGRAWMFFISLVFLWCALNVRPARAIFILTALIPISILIPFLILGFSHWILSFFQILLMAIAIHYIAIPILLGRFLSIQEKKSLEIKSKLEEERLTNRIVAQSAQANFATNLARQVAHDIRGPLTAVNLISNLPLENLTKDHTKLLSDASLRLQRVAQDILSKSIAKNIQSSKSFLQLDRIISDLILAFKETFPQINFRFLNTSNSTDFLVEIDESVIERALTNLLTNAIEALQANKIQNMSIEILLKKEVDGVHIGINDNGPGVPPEIANKLFKEQVTHGKENGHGLGLFGTYAALSQVGCDLKYERSNDQTFFWITIPSDKQKIIIPVQTTLLAVDYDKEVIQYLKKYLPKNLSFLSATTAEDAIPMIQDLLKERKHFTLLTEVTFSSGALTGFDLLHEVHGSEFVEKYVFTVLADNKEIQTLVHKLGVQIFSKAALFRADFKILS